MTTAKITGVMNKPETNGDYLVEISLPDRTIMTASISMDIARAMVTILQTAIVEEAAGRAQSMSFAGIQVRGASMVHHGPTAELMVGTNEMGQLVLEMSDEWLLEVRQVIDRVLTSRQSSKTIQ
jgi:hypothetical protein